MRARVVRLLAWVPLFALAVSTEVRADPDQKLVLMHEPTPYTDVVDATDSDDRFDLNVHIGYVRTVDSGSIQREHTEGGERLRSLVAESKHTRSQLMFELDVGIWKDLMGFLRLPLILSDQRSIGVPGGRSREQLMPLLTDPGDFAGRDGSLFGLPLDSPARAGFDYVGLGVAMAVTNQERKPWLPTWVLRVEGRRALGRLIRPCVLGADGKPSCGHPRRDQGSDADNSDGASLADETGAGRGVSALSFETRVSKRIRYWEPYAGLGALMEWASQARKYFQPGGELRGFRDSQPSRQFSATLGSEIIPWEHRGRYQRVAIDVRLMGTYYTRGRDYSVLFDALGTSGHAALAQPNFEGVRGRSDEGAREPCQSDDDQNCLFGRSVAFHGLTNLSSRLKYGGRLGMDIRAARYVRFLFGAGVSFVTAHALTGAEPCNLDVSDASRSQLASGQSCGSHPSNPLYRPTIDSPGRRFWMTSELLFELYASAVAQF